MFRHLAAGLAVVGFFQANPVSSPTVEGVYRGLSSGPLRNARLADLPGSTVLRAGGMQVTQQQLAADIAKAPAAGRTDLKRNQFHLLEQRAARLLPGAEAAAWAKGQNKAGLTTDDARIGAYLQSIAAKAAVTDAEARTFYAANRDMVSGAACDSVATELKRSLLDEKRQAAVDAYIGDLSRRASVQVDAAWCKAQSASALDNPVDRARRSGKPALVDFGSKGCRPCDMLAPILDELRRTYAGRCAVLFVQVTENQLLAARYGISSIPVQIFFDRDGNEVSRHVGFYPKAEILKRLAALGVK